MGCMQRSFVQAADSMYWCLSVMMHHLNVRLTSTRQEYTRDIIIRARSQLR